MPLGQYNVKNYIESLLKKIGIEFGQDDVISYADMVNYSIGLNPRSMKRLFNSLLLLNLVAEKKKLFDKDASEAQRGEKQRIMFGCLCLQTAYEPVYKYMQENTDKINQGFFESFEDINDLKNNSNIRDITKELSREDDTMLKRLSQFMGLFYESIQLKSDSDKKLLSDKELETLREILEFSSVTSIDASTIRRDNKRYDNRDMAKEFVWKLNEKYADILQKIDVKDSFKMYQGRNSTEVDVYFWASVNNIKFSHEFWFDDNYISYTSAASNQAARDFGKQWFDKIILSCPDYFANPTFSLKEYSYATLWKIEFPPNLDRSDKVRMYEEEVVKTLDIILPKLLESKDSMK